MTESNVASSDTGEVVGEVVGSGDGDIVGTLQSILLVHAQGQSREHAGYDSR